MKISIWDIFRYVYKWKIVIIVIMIMSMTGVWAYVDRNQTYGAEIILRYTDKNAKNGLTPDGGKLDVYEILSPNIISGAISELNIKESVEAIRSKIVITPIIPDEVVELKKSMTKEGKEYNYFATDYSVKYTAGSDKSGAYARDIIDTVVKNYSVYYSERYLNNGVLPEADFDIDTAMYDYLEITEIMNANVKDTVSYLEERGSANPDFRSPLTGKSFLDLTNDYLYIKNIDLPGLFSNILNSQITQNKETLLKKYQYRKQQYILENKNKTEESNVALTLMEDFVKSNKTVPNSYNQNDPNTQNDNSNFNNSNIFVDDAAARTKTTYDKLVDNYVLDGVKAGTLLVDIAYCDKIITSFSGAPNSSVSIDDAKKTADSDILYIKGKLEKLYKITDDTIRDYNSLNASNNIVSLSGINISIGTPINLYLLLALVIGTLLGIVFAIAIELILGLKKEQ